MRDPNAKTLVNTALVKEMRARRQQRPLATPPPNAGRSPSGSSGSSPPSPQ